MILTSFLAIVNHTKMYKYIVILILFKSILTNPIDRILCNPPGGVCSHLQCCPGVECDENRDICILPKKNDLLQSNTLCSKLGEPCGSGIGCCDSTMHCAYNVLIKQFVCRK